MPSDDQQFKQLVADLRPQLLTVARRLCGSTTDAEDLAQRTVLRALERWQSFKPGTDLFAWSSRILRNLFFDDCASPTKKHVPFTDEQEAMLPGGGHEEEELPWMNATTEQIQAAVEQLSEHLRLVFLLSEFEGRSHAEISAILGIPVGTAGRRLWTARQQLKQQLTIMLKIGPR